MNTLRNQWAASRGWMFSTFIFAVFCIYLMRSLSAVVNDMPVRLVPYDFDASTGPVEVGRTVRSAEEYLTKIAAADLHAYTTWNPTTVRSQKARFLNRTAPQLYAQIGETLRDTAIEYANGDRTQAFFMDRTFVREDTVHIEGVLRIWSGTAAEATTQDVPMQYRLRYVMPGGVPYMISFNGQERQGQPRRSR